MKIAIIGAGGHGKVVAEIAELNGYKTIHFFDNDLNKYYLWEIVGSSSDIYNALTNYDAVFVAIGSNNIRKEFIQKLLSLKAPVTSLIHPSATISSRVSVAQGSLIAANVAINSGTKVGIGSIINTGSNIDHDCDIGNYTHIAPGVTLSGNVTVGNNCWIGVGSTIIQQCNITNDTYLGAGSLVIKDILESGLYFGSPATKQK